MGKRENWEEILEGEKGSEMYFGWKKLMIKNFYPVSKIIKDYHRECHYGNQRKPQSQN